MEEQNRIQGNEIIEQNQNAMPPQVPPLGGNAPVPPPPLPPMRQNGYGVPPLPPMQQNGYGVPPLPPMQQPGYGTGMQPYGVTGAPETVSDGLAIASMVLGIISILACVWFYIAIPCAIVGLVLGCVYRVKGGRNGMSVAGIACSGSGLALALLIVFLLIVDVWMYW